jgi:rhodanese-related sulfurtransferase
LNSIDNNTLANLLKTSTHPLLIIDARFDYEFEGGHIKGALNLNTPEALEEFFF